MRLKRSMKLRHFYKSLPRPNKPQRRKPRTRRPHSGSHNDLKTLDLTSNYPYKGVINPSKDLISWSAGLALALEHIPSLPERCGGVRLPTDPRRDHPRDIVRVPSYPPHRQTTSWSVIRDTTTY